MIMLGGVLLVVENEEEEEEEKEERKLGKYQPNYPQYKIIICLPFFLSLLYSREFISTAARFIRYC